MAKKPTEQTLLQTISSLEEIISKKNLEIEQAKREGLSKEDKTKLSFFNNLSDNIAVWAARGREDNYEIVFWNGGAENIYGYSKDEAVSKNFIQLFISDIQKSDAQKDCDAIIETGTPYKNNIATDYNRRRKQITLITNTFRIDDYEREGKYLQGEIGLDVSDLQEFTGYRSLQQLNSKYKLHQNLIDAIYKIDQEAPLVREKHIELFSKSIVGLSETLFGKDHLYVMHWEAFSPLGIEQNSFSNKHLIGNENLLEKINAYKNEIHVRMRPKKPVCRLTTTKTPHAVCPVFSDTEHTIPLGYFLIEFNDDFQISDDISSGVNVFICQIHFALRFIILNMLYEQKA